MSVGLNLKSDLIALEASLPFPEGAGKVIVYRYGRPENSLITVYPSSGGVVKRPIVRVYRALEASGREAWIVQVRFVDVDEDRVHDLYGKTYDFTEAVHVALDAGLTIAKHAKGLLDINGLYKRLYDTLIRLRPVSFIEIHFEEGLRLVPFTPVEARKAVYAVEQAISDLAKENR